MIASSACRSVASGVVRSLGSDRVADPGLDRADQAGRSRAARRPASSRYAGGGLAVRPGHAERQQALGRVAVHRGGDRAEHSAWVRGRPAPARRSASARARPRASVRTATAPAATASAAKSARCRCAPGTAAKRSPGRTARESIVTPDTTVEPPVPGGSASPAAAATAASGTGSGALGGRRGGPASARPAADQVRTRRATLVDVDWDVALAQRQLRRGAPVGGTSSACRPYDTISLNTGPASTPP